MKCPFCGNMHCELISESTSKGFSVSKGCCGYICLGPLGLLCGLFGMGTTKTDTYWVCTSCGKTFKSDEGYQELIVKISDSILRLDFILDLNLQNSALNSAIIEKFYSSYEDFFISTSVNFKNRLITTMPSNSEGLLRLKTLVWSILGQNKDFISDKEELLFAIDDSSNLKGDRGLIVTSKTMYFHNNGISLESVSKIELDINNDIIINGISIEIKSLSVKDLNNFSKFMILLCYKSKQNILEEKGSNGIGLNNRINGSTAIKCKNSIFFL